MQVFNLFKQFKQEILKLQDRIAGLERRIEYLESDPWKMPFDQ